MERRMMRVARRLSLLKLLIEAHWERQYTVPIIVGINIDIIHEILRIILKAHFKSSIYFGEGLKNKCKGMKWILLPNLISINYCYAHKPN